MTDPFPDVLRMEPTGACNLHCQHCPTGIYPNGRGRMRYLDFARYMDMIPVTPRVLVLYHGGEPLMNPELPMMLKYAKRCGVGRTVLNTNGMLLGKMDLSDLDEMRVSIDGNSAEEMQAIRKGARYEWIVGNLLRFMGRNQHTKVIIYNVRIETDGTTPEFILERFGDYPQVEYRNEPMRTWAIYAPPGTPVADYCDNLFETFTILSDGGVVMCCEDITADDIIGNVNCETPLDIWRGMQERRDKFRQRIYPELCRGCHVVTGNYL